MITSDFGLKKWQLDNSSLRKSMEPAVKNLIDGAARAWLKAILSFRGGGNFPHWSGMVQASMQPIGRRLGVNFAVRPPQGKRPDRRAEGQAAGVNFSFSIKRNQYGPFSFGFKWENEVFHFELNDRYQVNTVKGTPWHAIQRGERAFIQYIESNMVRILPNIGNYLVVS